MKKSEVIAKAKELLIQHRDDPYALVPHFEVRAYDAMGRLYSVDSRSGQFNHVVVTNHLVRDEFGRSFSGVRSLGDVYEASIDGKYVAVDQLEKIIKTLEGLLNIRIELMKEAKYAMVHDCGDSKIVDTIVQTDDLTEFTFVGLFSALEEYVNSRIRFAEFNLSGNEIQVEITWGDWSHDHRYLIRLVKKFYSDRGIIVQSTSQTTDENGSDCYSAVHTFSEFVGEVEK